MNTSLETISKVVNAERKQELLLAAAKIEATRAPFIFSDLAQKPWLLGMSYAAEMLRARAAEVED